MNRIDGIIIPCVTPFTAEGDLDEDALAFNYDKWNKTGVNGYMALGSNGEFTALDDDEALRVLKIASRTAAKDKCMIAGIARESVVHTLRFMHRVLDAGVLPDYFSLLTPHYFKKLMTDDALYAYYARVADESPVPVLLYCAPVFSNNVVISPELLQRLADHPNIHGVKDTSTDMMDAYMDAVGGREDFEVFSGSVNTIRHCMDRGGRGGVISVANYFPDECAEYLRLYRAKDPSADACYTALAALAKSTGGRGGVAGVKMCMNLLGYRGGSPRLPVLPVSDTVKAEIEEALRAAGKR